MDDIEGILLYNQRIVSNHFLARIRLSRSMGRVSPGQFVMIRLPSEEVFFRRPFSIYDHRDRTLSILYRVVGKGTNLFSMLTTRDKVMVLGPLGRPFQVARGMKHVVVAGGIGVAGINFLWTRLKGNGLLFYGCCKGDEVKLLGPMKTSSPFITTEDGSVGVTGLITDVLASRIEDLPPGKTQVFACGPEGMYRSLKAILQGRDISCQVLVEERMACGLGLCFGCVKKTFDEKEPYKRACLEGPVFDLWQICL